MSTTLKFECKIAGVLTDVNDCVLSDQSGTFGVRRVDNGVIVVSAGTIVPRLSLGTYEITFADPEPELVYEYTFHVTLGADDYYLNRQSSMPKTFTDLSFGRYANSECVYLKYGRDNVDKWTDLDVSSTQQEKDNRLQNGINWAENYVDDMLRGGPYAIPFVKPVPDQIKDIACSLSGYKIYTGRGIQDESGRFDHILMHCNKQLAFIKAGRIELRPDMSINYMRINERPRQSDTRSAPIIT